MLASVVTLSNAPVCIHSVTLLNKRDFDVCLFIPSAGAGQFATSICDSTLHEDTSVGRQNNLQNQVSIVSDNQAER